MSAPTAEEKLAVVKRELGMRHRVYPRRVFEGKMTQAQADRETAIMAAIVTDYEVKAQSERLI